MMPNKNENSHNWPMPQGACDTHFHLYDSAVPLVPDSGGARGIATGDAATPDAEIKCMDALGMRGFRYFRMSGVGADGERMVWAATWPPPMLKSNFPDEMDLLNVLRRWVHDEAARRCVPLSNPLALCRM